MSVERVYKNIKNILPGDILVKQPRVVSGGEIEFKGAWEIVDGLTIEYSEKHYIILVEIEHKWSKEKAYAIEINTVRPWEIQLDEEKTLISTVFNGLNVSIKAKEYRGLISTDLMLQYTVIFKNISDIKAFLKMFPLLNTFVERTVLNET